MNTKPISKKAIIYRGRLAWLSGNPFRNSDCLKIIDDGALTVCDGKIQAITRFDDRLQDQQLEIVHCKQGWLLPGFIDNHIHFPQTFARARPGHQLMDWLEKSIFPAESALSETAWAEKVAELFCQALIRSGTTSAAVYGSQFVEANMALADAAKSRGLQMCLGPSLMDQGAPNILTTPAAKVLEDAYQLREAFGDSRHRFAITPRFALSCSADLIKACRTLIEHFPSSIIQTHINESGGEISAVAETFPDARNYLDVYVQQGLVSERTLLAHSIHSTEEELEVMASLGAKVVHCPTSNAYLGSGIHSLANHQSHGVDVCLGTDVGAGLHFSMLREMQSAFLLQKLAGQTLDASHLLYLATLAGAEALGLANRVGNFEVGKDADFIHLCPTQDPLLATQLAITDRVEDDLFCSLMLGGPELIQQVWTLGEARLAGAEH